MEAADAAAAAVPAVDKLARLALLPPSPPPPPPPAGRGEDGGGGDSGALLLENGAAGVLFVVCDGGDAPDKGTGFVLGSCGNCRFRAAAICSACRSRPPRAMTAGRRRCRMRVGVSLGTYAETC